MTESKSVISKVINACNKRGINQQNAFQSFVTGGVTALAGVGTLLLLDSNSQSLQHEIMALIAIVVAGLGICFAGVSYILLLILRLGQAPASTGENSQ